MTRNILIILFVIILLFAIPVSVYLAKQQQDLQSYAYAKPTNQALTFSGPNVDGYTTKSENVVLNISFLGSSVIPTQVRVANFLQDLDNAQPLPFSLPSIQITWNLPPQNTSHAVFAQFKINDKWQSPLRSSIILAK